MSNEKDFLAPHGREQVRGGLYWSAVGSGVLAVASGIGIFNHDDGNALPYVGATLGFAAIAAGLHKARNYLNR